MKSSKTVQLSRHESDQPESKAAASYPGISRLFCLVNAGALLVGIVVLWTQLRDQESQLNANTDQLEDNSRLNEAIATLAVRNFAMQNNLSALNEGASESKEANEALAGSIRNISLNLADLGNDLRSDMAYFRQEQDSIFATLDAVSIMTANQNERLDNLNEEVAETDVRGILDELRGDMTDIRQDYLNQQTDLADMSTTLTETRTDLTDTWRELMDARTELTEAKTTLNNTQTALTETQTELTETRNASAVIAISSDQLTKKFAELEEALTEQIFANTQNKPITVQTPSAVPSENIPAEPSLDEESSDPEDFNFDPETEENSTEEESFDDGSYDEEESFDEEEFRDETDD